MCIIAMKEQGIKMPNLKTLEICFKNNPDGAGILYQNPGQKEATILKGFMTWKAFRNALSDLPITKESRAVFHFRITTAGGTRPENCHPFPVSANVAALKALKITTAKALIHNGIIGQGEGHLSDTQLFIRDFVAQKPFVDTLHLPTTRAALEAMTAGSRLVIFDAQHDVFTRTGAGWVEDQGVWYSNSGYLPSLPKRAHSKYDYDDWAWSESFTKSSRQSSYCPNCDKKLSNISKYHTLSECSHCGYLYDHNFDYVYYPGDI